MSFWDKFGGSFKGALGQIEAAAVPALLSAVLAKTEAGGLQGAVDKLRNAGFGNQVQSWLGNGANQPITADQIRTALGSEPVRQIAAHLGIPVDRALNLLSEHLPTAVDQASPNGRLEAAS
jgi:uncharacterized protein YidB (DUF937 family)